MVFASILLLLLQAAVTRSEEHTFELQSRRDLVCRLLLEKKKRPESADCGVASPAYRNRSLGSPVDGFSPDRYIACRPAGTVASGEPSFFIDPATTEIYTLSLHYALPI